MPRRHIAGALIAVVLMTFATSANAEIQHKYRESIRKIITELTPVHVSVEAVEFDGARVSVRGTTTNVNAAANFVENVKAHPKFSVPEDIFMAERKGSDPAEYDFRFRFEVKERPPEN